MQKKLAGDGLVAISVSVDDLEEKDTKDKVLKFLTKQNATFTNLILNEKSDVWQQKLDISGPPVVFVYDRTGKLAKKYDEGVKYDAVEKLVRELLQKK
jgi:hypothetical protein